VTTSRSRARRAPSTGAFRPTRAYRRISTTTKDAKQFDTIRLCLIKVAARVTEMVTRIKIALPSTYPYRAGFTMLAGQIAKLPP
jgi:hypothetical protein